MPSLNKVILIGNLVADPELKQTQTGISVCSFRIGVQRRFKNQDGTSTSDFLDIVAWRQTAEFVCKYFRKGKPICVCGSLQTRSWTDQQGNKRWSVEVVADEVTFTESKGDGSTYGGQSAPYTQSNSYGQSAGYTPTAQPSQTDAPYAPAPSYSSENASAAPAKFEELASDDDLPF